MILIIGGAYQGKLEYARNTYELTESDIFICTGPEIDFSRRCIGSIEEFTRACQETGTDPTEYFRANRNAWCDSVLICQDLFCGVVPMGAQTRAWRQSTGRLCQYLAKEADQVIRIFCGLEQRLK